MKVCLGTVFTLLDLCVQEHVKRYQIYDAFVTPIDPYDVNRDNAKVSRCFHCKSAMENLKNCITVMGEDKLKEAREKIWDNVQSLIDRKKSDLFIRALKKMVDSDPSIAPNALLGLPDNSISFSQLDINDYGTYVVSIFLYAALHTENKEGAAYVNKITKEYLNDVSSAEQRPNTGYQNSNLSVRPASYSQLLELGYSSIEIAEALVKNDMKLYGGFNGSKGIAPENEGSALQWSQYLSSFPDSFRYILNSSNQIVGNFSFLSLTSSQALEFTQGRLSESIFTPSETRDLFSAGDDHILFLLNLSLNDEYSTPKNNTLLRRMFLEQLLLFAEEDVLFSKIIVNVFKPSHEAFYKQWGFAFVDRHKHSGRIFELILNPYPEKLYRQLSKNHQLKDINERLKEIYRNERLKEIYRKVK